MLDIYVHFEAQQFIDRKQWSDKLAREITRLKVNGLFPLGTNEGSSVLQCFAYIIAT